MSNNIPKMIFIVPYRNREYQKIHFDIYMKYLLEDIPQDTYKIYFVHQNDKKPFNRGAMKNIGFLAIKNLYPNDYKHITLIFNDIDTMPFKKNLINYNTEKGIVKHFYGYNFALGGIFSIKGGDFEKTKGFPNFWGWGLEDNCLNKRANEVGLIIDRSNFYKIGDYRILQVTNDLSKLLSKNDIWIYKSNENDNLFDIKNLKYNIENEYINVTNFNTKFNFQPNTFYKEDSRTNIILPDKKFYPKFLKRSINLNILKFK